MSRKLAAGALVKYTAAPMPLPVKEKAFPLMYLVVVGA